MLIFYCKCLSIWMQGVDCIPWTVEKRLSSICRKCAAWGQGHRNVSRNLYLSPTVLNFTIRYETLCIVQINTYFALKLFCFEIHNKVPVYYAVTNEKINFTDLVMGCMLYLENTAKLIFWVFFPKTHTFCDSPIRRTLSKITFAASQPVSCSWPMLFPFA